MIKFFSFSTERILCSSAELLQLNLEIFEEDGFGVTCHEGVMGGWTD